MIEQPSTALPSGGAVPLAALLDRARRTPEAAALVEGGKRWTCSHLAEKGGRLAAAFSARGVRSGDRVALHMSNRIELVLAYLACWWTGAIAVPINTRYKAPEVAATIGRVGPALYIGETGLQGSAADVPADVLPSSARFVVGHHAPEGAVRPWSALEAFEEQPVPDVSPVDRRAPALLLGTSGTTGPSKLVVWGHDTLACLVACGPGRGVGPGDVFPLAMPMMHASGAHVLAMSLATGALPILLPRFEAGAVLDAVQDHRCTTLLGLPFMFAEMARCQSESPRDVGSLRLCLVGGDVCPSETERRFEEAFGRALLSIWVATEELCGTSPATRAGPLTRLSPASDVRLVDDAGETVRDGETGEMLIRSPGTSPGYWLGPGRIDPLPGGWFHTGDLMRREPDAQLRYMGRLKDLIVRGGSNISPVEVEEALRRQPGVADAAVTGLPDPDLGQRVGAALVLADGTTRAAVPDILAALRCDLADYKVPERVGVVETIPRNALTKVDRRAVAASLAELGTAV